MKYMIFLICLVHIQPSFAGVLQPQKDTIEAISILRKVEQRLNKLTVFSCHQVRETKYHAGNYYNFMEADIYMQNEAKSPIGLRFQAKTKESRFIYDGITSLQLNEKEKTIDSATVNTRQKISNNSFLYHSLAMLRNILPVIISNDSIQKTVRDTTIGNKQLLSIRLEGSGMYFQLFGGVEHFNNAALRRPYYLLVDIKTYLPYQFIAKYIRGNDDRDYVTVTYRDISTTPMPPTSASWKYATYAASYAPYKPKEKKQMVRIGEQVQDFRLLAYTTSNIDTVSLTQYSGKIVLLDFWFKSCGPCMEAMPHYNELQNRFGTNNFQLLTINIEDGQEDIKFFYNKYNPVYKMLYNGRVIFDRLGLKGCPSAILVDGQGKVIYAAAGFNRQQIEAKIEQAIAAQKTAKL